MTKLKLNNGGYLNYRQFSASGSKSNVVFLSGFRSDIKSSKAQFLYELCAKLKVNYTCFDYEGCGSSSGDFLDMNISKWKENTRELIEKLYSEGQVILIGSSMGGWIMSLLAREMPEKIQGMIGLASAPDFTEKLMWAQLSEAARKEIMEKGVYYLPTNYCNNPADKNNTYPITRMLIEDGRKNNILESGEIEISCPVTLIHGLKDEDVPYNFSLKLAEIFTSKQVDVILQPEGKHRMSEPQDLALLQKALEKHIITV